MNTPFFTQKTFTFLALLAKNNNRTWFNEHKAEYEDVVREPALNFIDEMRPFIKELSPHFTAINKKTGGSLMRVYRDIRFSHDKTPYKTNIGIKFKHEINGDMHAPGFYCHISPHINYVGAGAWRPNSKAIAKIREMISDNPNSWKNITSNKKFKRHFELFGESLKTYPRGYAKDHPLINDLKRKDFIARHHLSADDIISPTFIKTVQQRYKTSSDFVDYLCTALDLPY